MHASQLHAPGTWGEMHPRLSVGAGRDAIAVSLDLDILCHWPNVFARESS